MLKFKKLKMPMPVTLNDCLLLWQMGYRVEINDGRVTAVVKESKKNNGFIAADNQLHCITGNDGVSRRMI